MPDKPKKPNDRRDFFRKLMLGALDKAEASTKQVGSTIADALRAAQTATEKKRLEDEARKLEEARKRDAANHPQSTTPPQNDTPIIRRPDNRISRGSLNLDPLPSSDTPSDPPPEPPGAATDAAKDAITGATAWAEPKPCPDGPSTSLPPAPRSTRILRPPGALPEEAFQSTCSRCGQCVSVCPASCIMLDVEAPNASDSLPHIIARESACTACASIACTNACPTGALTPLHHISQISLGLAIVNHDTCLRTATATSPAKDCRQCITPCPIGETAIGIDQLGQIQIRPGCIGCGLCEQSCPTDPTSIYVDPSLAPERPAPSA